MSEHHHLFFCTGTTCTGQGAEASLQSLRVALEAKNIKNTRLTLCRCLGQCGSGPNMVIYGGCHPDKGIWYGHLMEEEIAFFISQHLIKGEVISRLMITPV